MTRFSDQNANIALADEKLGRLFYASGRYNAIFLGVTSIGFVIIYILTRFNLLGEPTPQLLYISGAVLLTAILQIPAVNLARRNRGIAANFIGTLSIILFAIVFVSFWEGIVPLAILVILITPLTAIFAGMPRRYFLPLGLLIVTGIGGIFYVNANPPFVRLQTATAAAVASLAFLGTTGLLLITVTLIARSRSYRSLRTQLLVLFIIIVTIPTLLATILSAIGAYVNNETQVLNVLETVSKLKENQIDAMQNSRAMPGTF